MTEDEVWAAIDAHRLSVAGLLEELTEEEWRRPSLCAGWTVRDVAAHLTLQQLNLADVLRGLPVLVSVRGSMNRMIYEMARRKAARPATELIAEIRGMAGSRRHNFGVTYRETLIDILVHSQDIAVPLHRPLALPPEAAAVAAAHAWALSWPFHARKKMQGFRLTATDTVWTAGEGRDVHAPIGALLLLLTGRLTPALPHLSGDGAQDLATRLT